MNRQFQRHDGRPRQPGHDRVLDELSAHVHLGMKSEALRLARRLLKRRRIKGREFNAALEAVLIQADRAKPWKPLVEAAYERLSKRERPSAQFQMLGFYYSIYDWESAFRFLPFRPSTAWALLFSMETLLNLKKMEAARRIQRRCLRMLRQPTDPDSRSALLQALASYHAQIGEIGAAEQYWMESSTLETFRSFLGKRNESSDWGHCQCALRFQNRPVHEY